MSNRGILLTGASGTIGQYILKNLLESGNEVALLVRDRGQSNARQRVEKLISDLDVRRGFPNPRIITWDLCRDGSQMPSEDKSYLINNVTRILHCAASVQFLEDPRSGEPWRSNVEGTRNLLALANEIGGVHFYHVSTAYVCGAHQGTFLESTHWAPTSFNNVYEQSKYQAEQLVLEARSQLASVTILRPSIVVGDSNTGRAPTFNTLYAGLRFASALSENDTHSIPSLLQGMQLDGKATKNVVPVNWVAEMISEIVCNDRLAGGVYHLTHHQPISVAEICQAMIEAIALEPEHWTQMRQMTKSSLPLDDAIASYLKPFQSYFKNDPVFDSKNIAPLKEKYPLPLMDQAVLVKLFRFAIRSLMRSQPHASASQNTSLVRLHPSTWNALVEGKLSLREAMRLGAVVVCGPLDMQCLAIEGLRRKLEQQQLSMKQSMPIDTWPTDRSLLEKGVLHG